MATSTEHSMQYREKSDNVRCLCHRNEGFTVGETVSAFFGSPQSIITFVIGVLGTLIIAFGPVSISDDAMPITKRLLTFFMFMGLTILRTYEINCLSTGCPIYAWVAILIFLAVIAVNAGPRLMTIRRGY